MSDNGSCSACNPESCSNMSGMMLIKKLQNMLSDNYTMLVIMVVLIGVLGLVLFYFANSLSNTLTNYYKNKKVAEDASTSTAAISDNQRDVKADNEIYYENVQDDPNKQDPVSFLDKTKQDFIAELDSQYKDINTLKTQYISSTYSGKQNDDVIDQKVLYKDYDNYKYDLAPDD